MRALAKVVRLGIVGCLAVATAPAAAATTFNFQFDYAGIPAPDGPVIPPFAGTGTFISPVDLNVGTYDLASLVGFSVNFSFLDGNTYSTADISTPLTGLAIQVTDLGGGLQRLYFTESGGLGSDGGPHGGSLDLDSGSNFLCFAPTTFANYLYQESGASGRYVALSASVPEPSTWAMMMMGFGVIGFAMRRRRDVVLPKKY
jgi:hypothetical protein